MDHKKFQELLLLNFSGELNAQERSELKNHLEVCVSCSEEFENYALLKNALVKNSSGKVTDKLLQDARSDLRNRLLIERRKSSSLSRFFEPVKEFFSMNYRYVINGAVTMAAGLIIGFFIFRETPADADRQDFSSVSEQIPEDISQIRNIRLVDTDPGDENIEFTFETVKQVNISGSINDEKVKNVLMYAIMNGKNAGVRLNSLNLLNSSVQGQPDTEIKDAIISAVKYDDNPGVRREALKVLNTFPFDDEVKRSYLYIVMNDTSSALRIEAINALSEKGGQLNNEEENLFRERLNREENSYIKFRAKTVLGEYL